MDVSDNILRIRETMAEAARRSGRPASAVRLMAVTKTVDDDRIFAAIRAGVEILGENYVQEANRKIDKMGNPCEWHMIGRLQKNKVRHAVRHFDMIQSLDRIELAREINKESHTIGKVTKVLIEVNTGQESTKSGVSFTEAIDLAKTCSSMDNISLRGLMTIPPWFDDPEGSRHFFARLRGLRDAIESLAIPGIVMEELSMGMTNDFPVAVEEGATIVRIGRGLFGERCV